MGGDGKDDGWQMSNEGRDDEKMSTKVSKGPPCIEYV